MEWLTSIRSAIDYIENIGYDEIQKIENRVISDLL